MDERLLDAAGEVGTALRLRSTDALYAACAAAHQAPPLVTWDGELLARAGAWAPPQALGA